MRTRLTTLRIRYDKVWYVIRICFGILLIYLAAIIYSGYSIKINGMSNILTGLFVNENIVMNTICEAKEEGARTLACTYFWENITPFEGLFDAEKKEAYGITKVDNDNVRVGANTYSLYEKIVEENDNVKGEVEVVKGDSYSERTDNSRQPQSPDKENAGEGVVAAMSGRIANEKEVLKEFESNHSTDFLLKHFYIVDSTTSAKKSLFNVDKLLNKKLSIKKDNSAPQILIYHTHAASEGFTDSKPGDMESGIVGVGNTLTRILTEQYGYNVYHDKTAYDMINGKIDRSAAYAKALPALKQILKDNPSIKVIIDIHRDGVGTSDKGLTIVNGKKTARAMFFNGLSRSVSRRIDYLKNDNQFANLAFSLQMKLKAMELYPDFTKPIYLKGYRYNLHLLGRSLLIELGNQNNTVSEANNAAPLLADIINAVLSE